MQCFPHTIQCWPWVCKASLAWYTHYTHPRFPARQCNPSTLGEDLSLLTIVCSTDNDWLWLETVIVAMLSLGHHCYHIVLCLIQWLQGIGRLGVHFHFKFLSVWEGPPLDFVPYDISMLLWRWNNLQTTQTQLAIVAKGGRSTQLQKGADPHSCKRGQIHTVAKGGRSTQLQKIHTAAKGGRSTQLQKGADPHSCKRGADLQLQKRGSWCHSHTVNFDHSQGCLEGHSDELPGMLICPEWTLPYTQPSHRRLQWLGTVGVHFLMVMCRAQFYCQWMPAVNW